MVDEVALEEVYKLAMGDYTGKFFLSMAWKIC
jgi:hypothetical protein